MVPLYNQPYDLDPIQLSPPKLLAAAGAGAQEASVDPESDGGILRKPEDATVKLALHRLLKQIDQKHSTNQEIFESYQALPFPGVAYISHFDCRSLLRKLSIMQTKSEVGMIRYLSVIDDVKAAELPITRSEWNSAVHLAGRCFARVTEIETEAALLLWKEMEQEGGVKGNECTFNILFDIAVKAGQYVLAEMILEEMKARNLKLDRHGYVGLIFYHGVRGNGDEIRTIYRDFVNAGQIVDTVVLNCVIASLIRADELPAAEYVYERMKALQAKRTGAKPLPRDWDAERDLGRLLARAGRQPSHDSNDLQQLQDEQPLAPNQHTLIIFLRHHVSCTGELHRISALLDDYAALGLPAHGRVFLELFRGFARHGGIRYSAWTPARLESVWAALQRLLAEGEGDLYTSRWMAVWMVRAYARCCGRARTVEVWDALKAAWKAGPADEELVTRMLYTALQRVP
jgi:pentatricopeptide repeat protein